MTDDQFNAAMKAYQDRTKALGYIGNTIAGLATVIAILGGAIVGWLIWSELT